MAEKSTLPALMTYGEAAEKLKIAPATLRRFVSEKRIQCFRVGGHAVRFSDEQLAAALQPSK